MTCLLLGKQGAPALAEVAVRWGDRLSPNNHTSQDELAFMIEARAEMGLRLDWQVREGFLGVVMLQLRSEGSGGEREGRASFREQGMGASKLGGARDLEGLPR